MDFCTGDRQHIVALYRDSVFERCLNDLRSKGGEALVAAVKVDDFINILLNPDRQGKREKFRFTRNKEARIKHCKKVDLGCGYRIVCIKKDGHLALLYAGTHDDCLRWIERNKGMVYDFNTSNNGMSVVKKSPVRREIPEDVLREERLLAEYEAALVSRLDDAVLRKIFAGLCGMQPVERSTEP